MNQRQLNSSPSYKYHPFSSPHQDPKSNPKMRDDKDTELPPDDQRCTIIGGNWRCKHYKFQNYRFCRKHYLSHRGKIDGLSKKNRASLHCIDFKQGQEVEVSRKDESLKLSAWFKAKILKLSRKTRTNKKKKEVVWVQYHNEMDLVSEIVDFSLVRPLPPPPSSQEMKSFERIEAFCNGGWWKGEIFEVLENGRYIVECPIWGEKREVGVDELRIHQDWIDGEWVVPQHKGRDLGKDGTSNELDQSKRKAPTLRPRGRPPKMMHIEDIGVVSLSGQKEGESSMSVDPRRTTLDGIITESCTTTNLMEIDFTHKGRDAGTDRIANEPDQRKRKTPMSRPRGRPRKNMHKEDTGVVRTQWVDVPLREEGTHLHDSTGIFASPSRRLSDNQTPSFGQEISTHVSISDMSDPQNKNPHRDVADVIQTEWPSYGNELETLSNIKEASPLSICSVELFSPANPDDRMIDYNQVASKPRFAIAPGEASMDVAVQVEGALHQMTDTMQDATDIFTNLQISLSDGPQGDSSNTQIQLLQMSTKNTKSLNGKQSTEKSGRRTKQCCYRIFCTSSSMYNSNWRSH